MSLNDFKSFKAEASIAIVPLSTATEECYPHLSQFEPHCTQVRFH
jgi:hypothetical protein